MDSSHAFTLTCHGAAGEVTGSKHLIETPKGSRILLDCGMFQGRREEAAEKNTHFDFDPSSVDAVLLSHAHVDHCGLLPKFAKEGFSGPIYTTVGTLELTDFMLHDSAHIQEEDEKFVKKHDIENPLEKKAPLYTTEDVDEVMKQFKGVQYNTPLQVTDDVSVVFYEAGHVLGSSVLLLTIDTDEGPQKILFTGDLGRKNMPIIRDPEAIPNADYLICESTYGDRAHERVQEIEEDMMKIINSTAKRGGKILIPVFALERTQEMILRLEKLVHEKKIPSLPIFVDSPLAGHLTSVFEKHPEYYDEEMKQEHGGRNSFSFPGLKFTESVEESKELNYFRGPCIIMAGSGMCENGRIRHHLKNHIEDPASSIMIVGYQAVETLGRKLVEGEKVVKIFGRELQVKAELHVFKSLSAHADMNDLDEYVKSVKGVKKIFLVHGEQESRETFAERIKGFSPGVEIILPEKGQTYSL